MTEFDGGDQGRAIRMRGVLRSGAAKNVSGTVRGKGTAMRVPNPPPRITRPATAPKSAPGTIPAPRSRRSKNPRVPAAADRDTGTAIPDDRAKAAHGHAPDENAAAAAPDTEHSIDIRLDGAITAGSTQNRYDVLAAGVVIATDPLESVSLLVNGEVRAYCLYHRTDATEHVFRLGLFEREERRSDLTEFELAARTRAGHERRVGFAIATAPNDPDGPRVVTGPVCAAPLSAQDLAPVLLYVETAAVGQNGELRVAGWSVALTPIVAINVFAGEQRIGSADLGLPREDIVRAFPAYPNACVAGFAFAKAFPEWDAPATIAVEVVDLSGSVSRAVVPVAPRAGGTVSRARVEVPAQAASGKPARDRRRVIDLHCDEATLDTDGELLVAGWVVCPVGVATIEVRLDGELVGEAELDLSRPDVAEAYPRIPQARHAGFRAKLRVAPPAAGEHRLEIRACNGMDDIGDIETTVVAGAPVPAAPASASAAPADPGEFRFSLDHPVVIEGAVPQPVTGRLAIEGWAVARSGIEAIDVFLDGRILGQAYHGTARRDVEAAFPDWPELVSQRLHLSPAAARAGDRQPRHPTAAPREGWLVVRFGIPHRRAAARGHRGLRHHPPPHAARRGRALPGPAGPTRVPTRLFPGARGR